MTNPRSHVSRTARAAGSPAATTSVDVDRAHVVVSAHRFAWVDVAEVRNETARQVSTPGVVVRLDVSGMTDSEVSGLWVSALVRANRKARRAGSTLVIVGAPSRLASMLGRLRVPLSDQ